MYAIIRDTEIKHLSIKKAPAVAWALYSILASHEHRHQEAYCWPGIKRISKMMGNAWSESSIFRGLKWLEDEGFISRGHHRSRQRFKMLLRNLGEQARAKTDEVKSTVKQAAKKALKSGSQLCSQIRERKSLQTNDTSYLMKKKKNKRRSPKIQWVPDSVSTLYAKLGPEAEREYEEWEAHLMENKPLPALSTVGLHRVLQVAHGGIYYYLRKDWFQQLRASTPSSSFDALPNEMKKIFGL